MKKNNKKSESAIEAIITVIFGGVGTLLIFYFTGVFTLIENLASSTFMQFLLTIVLAGITGFILAKVFDTIINNTSKGMTFGMAIETCFTKYATFDGQASRREFWYFFLFGIICAASATSIDVFIFGISFDDLGYAYAITQLILFLPTISVAARRLHDTGRSGWWQLIILTGIGIILLIIWWAGEGGIQQKRYVKKTSSSKSELADELRDLKELYNDGTLSQEEFTKAKNKLLK